MGCCEGNKCGSSKCRCECVEYACVQLRKPSQAPAPLRGKKKIFVQCIKTRTPILSVAPPNLKGKRKVFVTCSSKSRPKILSYAPPNLRGKRRVVVACSRSQGAPTLSEGPLNLHRSKRLNRPSCPL
jgi:hypothetical protein